MQFPKNTLCALALLIGSLTVLNACGGGGGGSSNGGVINSGVNITYTPGSFPSSKTYAGQCAAPRSGTSDRQGSTTAENFWLRSWSHELYLWYRELPDLNPASYSTTSAYFNLLKTSATTSSGKAKDRFHFTYPTAEWIALSQSGVSAGYGAEWYFVASTLPRDLRVAFVEPGSPAAAAGLTRGVRIISIDGADVLNGNTQSAIDTLNAGLSPSAAGQTHSFVVRELNNAQRTVNMTSANVISTPVQNVTTFPGGNGATVGYMLFNDHIATAEQGLVNAFNQLRLANVSDLILDIRYNGGGYLDIASEVAYMIAGSTATNNRTFELTKFNDQYSSTDPVTGQPILPMPFHSTAEGFSVAAGTPLPTLNLPRVYVITGSGTCSASESIINGLRGIGWRSIK